jgi:predicted O-methyltransferase YrrM
MMFASVEEYIDKLLEDFQQRSEQREFQFDDVAVTINPGVFPSDSPYTYSPQSTLLAVKKDIENGIINTDEEYSILDLGTGCGIFSVWLSKHLPNARITAVDVHPQSIENARLNFDRCGIDVTLKQSDFFKQLEQSFDLIVTSIPFVDDWSERPFKQESLYRFWKTVGDHLSSNGVIYFNWADWADFDLAEQVAQENGFVSESFGEFDLPLGQYTWRTYRFKKK